MTSPGFFPWASSPSAYPGVWYPGQWMLGDNYPMPTMQTLVNRVRRYVRDWPELDSATASLSSSGTTVTVADTTRYAVNWIIEIDQEALRVTSLASSTSLTVVRAQRGSTAASHASSATILIRPQFFNVEIVDALNEGFDAAFPQIYRAVLNSTDITIAADTYEYDIPTMPSTTYQIPYLSRVEIKESGDNAWRETRAWEVRRGPAPKLKFRRLETAGATVRVHGYGPFPHIADLTDSVDSQWPAQAEELPVLWAASSLLASGEAGRVRVDTGAIDSREQANRVGSSSAISDKLMQRFYTLRREAAMQPMPKGVVSVF